MLEEDTTAIRQHIRHITGIPVAITLDYDDTAIKEDDTITNVSLGGLSFIADDRLDLRQPIEVNFPLLDKQEQFTGKVVWCEKTNRGYEIGLEFDDVDKIERLKVIEQICEFEKFSDEMAQVRGKRLSSEEIAREWSSFYAGEFSALN